MEENISNGLAEVASGLTESAEQANEFLKKAVSAIEDIAVKYGGKLIAAIIVLAVGFKLVNMLMRRLAKTKAVNRLDMSARKVVSEVTGAVLKCVIVVTALAIMGIPMSSIVAVVGSCGLAIGLALQGSLSNIAGGFILLVFKPFKVGDYVSFGDVEGTVREIGIFHVKIDTVDSKVVIIPNSAASNATLTNYTANSHRRVDIKFTASYGDDINKVEAVLQHVCRSHPLVLNEPAPFARLSAHLDSALEYTVRAWCNSGDYWTVYFDLMKNVKYAFDENGITVPFPQLEVGKHSDVR